jgi:hypothetical protein
LLSSQWSRSQHGSIGFIERECLAGTRSEFLDQIDVGDCARSQTWVRAIDRTRSTHDRGREWWSGDFPQFGQDGAPGTVKT